MPQSKQLKNESEFVDTLSFLTHAYQDVALMRLAKTRHQVIKTRAFFERLQTIYFEIKRAYRQQLQSIVVKDISTQKKIAEKISTKKSALVLLTANEKLYGSLSSELFKQYVDIVMKSESELFIIGRVGEEMYRQTGLTKPYTYFEFNSIDSSPDEFRSLALLLDGYESIQVFHGVFQSLFNQTSELTNIAGEETYSALDLEKVASAGQPIIQFLFEPSLDDVLKYFREQVRVILLQQSVHESQLAFNASRAVAMEEAIRQIDGRKLALIREKQRFASQTRNKKQLGSLNSILWSTRR